jgi:hypothetical protein
MLNNHCHRVTAQLQLNKYYYYYYYYYYYMASGCVDPLISLDTRWQWSASHSDRFTTGDTAHQHSFISRLVGPQNIVDAFGEEGDPLSLPGIESEHVGLVTSFAHV